MHERQLFTDYRKRQGLTQQQAADLAKISRRQVQKIERGETVGIRTRFALADALGIPIHGGPDGAGRIKFDSTGRPIENFDALMEPPSRFDQSLQGVPDSQDFGRKVSAAEIEFSIRRMRRSWQRHLESSTSERIGAEHAQFIADQRLNENVEAYVRRYMELWYHMPEVIQVSRVNGCKSGISVVLPVSAFAYRELQLGEKSFMDVGVGDLQRDSGYLVIDSVVEFDDAPRRKWYSITSSIRDAIIWQLIHMGGYPLPDDLRILSFGASLSNAKRLQASGFVDIGVPMKDYGYSLFELARDNSDLEEIYSRRESGARFANLLGRVLAESATLKMGIRVKRATFMGTMQFLQSFSQFRQQRDAS